MDLGPTFDNVVRIARDAVDPDSGWNSLIRYLEARSGESLPDLATVELLEDVRDLRTQLEGLLKAEPPPSTLDAIYFGLFDAVDDEETECIGFYIAGVEEFDPEDGDSLCAPAWWPDGRYLTSLALDTIKAAEISASAMGRNELSSLLGYTGQLGTALLLSKFASADLFAGRKRIVGFDSGDFAEIGPP